MSPGQLPIALILFGMIALFLVLRLRSILGKRQGFEGCAGNRHPAPPARRCWKAAPNRPRPRRARCPKPPPPTGQALAAMRAMDRQFDAATFLTGAEGAFRLIVTSFAAGERDKLRPLLTAETFAAFDAAVTARLEAGHTQRSEIRSILEAGIEDAHLLGSLATITVRFVVPPDHPDHGQRRHDRQRRRCGDRVGGRLEFRA